MVNPAAQAGPEQMPLAQHSVTQLSHHWHDHDHLNSVITGMISKPAGQGQGRGHCPLFKFGLTIVQVEPGHWWAGPAAQQSQCPARRRRALAAGVAENGPGGRRPAAQGPANRGPGRTTAADQTASATAAASGTRIVSMTSAAPVSALGHGPAGTGNQ